MLASTVIVLGLSGIVVAWLVRPATGGDTGPLMSGTETLADCLVALDLVSCEQPTPIGPWPILQYVPDLLGVAAGMAEGGRIRLLALLSGVGVAVALASAWGALRRIGCAEWRWAFLLVVATGPPLAYGNTTWGEMLGAGLLTLLVATALVPAHPLFVGLAAFGGGLTKETGYPFVAALGLVSLLLARGRTGHSVRRHVLALFAGLSLALAVSSAFNVLRYGTPKNAYYLDPALRTQGVDWFLELAAGLFVAPNGGIVFFWPLASLVVALLLSIPLFQAVRGVTGWRETWVSIAVLGIVGGLVAGLASWWAPFGWWAWGPRLSLPWVFPVLLIALAAFGRTLTPLAARALTRVSTLVLTAAIAVAVALPHVGYLWHRDAVGNFFFWHTTSVCPGGGPPPTPAYYDCLREQMWTRHPIVLDALDGLGTPQGAATAIALAFVVVGALLHFRREAMDVVRDAAPVARNGSDRV